MRPMPMAAIAVALAAAALAQPQPQPTQVVGARVLGESETRLTAVVENVDLSTRQVLLRREDGSLVTFRAGPEIRNLPQVKAGDTVVADLREVLSIALTRGETPPTGLAETTVRAPAGARPGIATLDTAQITAKVEQVNENERWIALRGQDGIARQVRVPTDVNFARIRPGDDVVLNVTRSVVLGVRPMGAAR